MANISTAGIAIVKNGNTAVLYDKSIIRFVTANAPFLLVADGKIDGISKNDYFEIWGVCTSRGNTEMKIIDMYITIEE
jgi:hypothetical protein